jgi:hypothetical protein
VFPILITTVERNPADLSARAHRQFSTEAFRALGQAWQTGMLPTRFAENAPNYPRKRRTRKYLDRKKKLFDQGKARFADVDNVLTGNMADILTLPGIVRAFPTHAAVNKIGPKYIGMRPYKSNQPDKWAELTWLADDEKQKLNATWLGTYDRLRDRRNETRTFSTG